MGLNQQIEDASARSDGWLFWVRRRFHRVLTFILLDINLGPRLISRASDNDSDSDSDDDDRCVPHRDHFTVLFISWGPFFLLAIWIKLKPNRLAVKVFSFYFLANLHKRRKHRGRALQNSGYDHRTFDILTVQLMYRIESTEKFRQRCPIGSTISHCLLTSFSPYFANQLPLCGCVCQSGAKKFLVDFTFNIAFCFYSAFFHLFLRWSCKKNSVYAM